MLLLKCIKDPFQVAPPADEHPRRRYAPVDSPGMEPNDIIKVLLENWFLRANRRHRKGALRAPLVEVRALRAITNSSVR